PSHRSRLRPPHSRCCATASIASRACCVGHLRPRSCLDHALRRLSSRLSSLGPRHCSLLTPPPATHHERPPRTVRREQESNIADAFGVLPSIDVECAPHQYRIRAIQTASADRLTYRGAR